MRETIRYCKKCDKKYIFQMSGKGCHNQKCSYYFCEDCDSEMQKLLEKVREKYKDENLITKFEDEGYIFSLDMKVIPERINFYFEEEK